MTLLQEAEALKKTPLYDRHVALKGKIVDFSGWALPIYYAGILAEHQWVRESCGIFDVSHLGEIHVSGIGAKRFLQYLLTNDLDKLENGKILYSLLCDERAMTLDDILIYQAAPDDYYLIVNAGSIARDMAALEKYCPDAVKLSNDSDKMACIAVQGPKSEAALEKIFGFGLKELGYYRFKEELFDSAPVWISRSGYTGEDGFEIFSSNEKAGAIWDRLVAAKSEGVLPAGLGARNTLRLEAGNALYGNDIDTTTTPLEANLRWAVSFDKEGGFIGRDMLLKERQDGSRRKLVGFKVLDKAPAREHYPIYKDGRKIGSVTSGSFGPTAGFNIALGYVDRGHEAIGNTLEIQVHGRNVPAEIVKLPFIQLKHRKG